jgi:hypothetical protein
MLGTLEYPITIAQMPSYLRSIERLLTDDEANELIYHLALHPEAGDVIPDTGGVRKLRWPAKNMGKRRGARIIYYFRDLTMPLYMLAAYAKNSKADISDREKNELHALVDTLVRVHGERWTRILRSQICRAAIGDRA